MSCWLIIGLHRPLLHLLFFIYSAFQYSENGIHQLQQYFVFTVFPYADVSTQLLECTIHPTVLLITKNLDSNISETKKTVKKTEFSEAFYRFATLIVGFLDFCLGHRPERPKGTNDEVKQAQRAATMKTS